MSQHISGDIGQSVRHDYGPFIKIGPMRVRREHLLCYHKTSSRPGDNVEMWGIAFSFNGTAFCFQKLESEAECDQIISQLDKQYDIESKTGKLEALK